MQRDHARTTTKSVWLLGSLTVLQHVQQWLLFAGADVCAGDKAGGIHLEVHDDSGMKGSNGEVKAVTPHFDGECHAAQGWLPF